MDTKICKQCNKEFPWKSRVRYCTECLLERQRNRCRNYKARNREKISDYNKTYKSDHKEEISDYNKAYDKAHRTEIQRRQTAYQRNRSKVDPKFKISGALRNRLRRFINTEYKSANFTQLLGCTYEDLMLWLEFQFESDMNLNNHGELWHYDHVIPCSLFNQSDSYEQEKCWHWTNIKPMYKSDNMSKQNKLTKKELRTHMLNIDAFLEKNVLKISDDMTILDYDAYEYVNSL